MDIATMKQDFYKRFDNSDEYLYHESCGLLCTLLGFPNIKGALSLTYPLSVGVTGLCRPSVSDRIELKSTASDEVFTKSIFANPSFIPKDAYVSGGQILLDNEIPKYFNSTVETKCCTIKCFMTLNKFSNYDMVAAAASCCGTDNIKPYLALLNAKPGYCIKSDKLKAESLPLPLSDFKLVSIQLDKLSNNKNDIQEIDYEIDKLKRFYPHMTSISDLSEYDIEALRPRIKSKQLYNRLLMIVRDNERIKSISQTLKSCRTSELFNQMNLSSNDFLYLWKLEKEEATLLKAVSQIEGVRATRYWNNGVIAIVYEERVDYVLSTIKNNSKRNGDNEIKFCISK